MTPASSAPPPTVIGPLTATLLAAGGIYATWRFFVATRVGQTLDALALAGSNIGAWRLDTQFQTLLGTVSQPLLIATMALVLVIGGLRREWLMGTIAAGVIAGANLTTQALKYWVFDRPVFAGIPTSAGGDNTLPSGHATVGASIAVALLLVVPPVLRAITAVAGAVTVTAFGFATLVNQWHRPSDVVAAALVVCGWAFLGVGVQRTVQRRVLVRTKPGAMFVVLLLAGIVALALATGAGYLCWSVSIASATRSQLFLAYAGGTALLAGVAASGTAMVLAMLQSAKRR